MFKKQLTGKLLALSIVSLLLTISSNINAQSTWSDIHAIIQTNCFGTDCHDAGAANGLVLMGNETTVYNNIIDATPTNPEAVARGYKLVDPGYPHFSYLLKKVNQGLDPDNDLDTIALGAVMPKALAPAPLTDMEIDLINAWILNGAPQTGTVVDPQLITDFHNGSGLAHEAPIAAPDPSEGFQIHFGSVFMEPNSEREFHLKRKIPSLTEDMEITRLETYIDLESHHYIIYKFNSQGDADNVNVGLREVSGLADAFVPGTNMVAAWQNESDIVLPGGTAYFWDPGTVLDLNLHIRNYSPDSILKAEVYTNIYWAPRQASTTEMISDLVLFSTLPITVPCVVNPFCIPNDGQDYTFTGDVTGADLASVGGGDSLYMWLLSSHTHKFGVGYDIYLRNPGGGKGAQVYDGDYNFDYTFNQGYYDFEDPAVRFFDLDTFVVNANDGFVHEATFNNDSSQTVSFGITTNDEMMLIFLQYTTERPVALSLSVSATSTAITPGNCDGTATATATNGVAPLTYLWDDPSTQGTMVASNLCGGIYTVQVTDSEGSISTATVTVIDPLTGILSLEQNIDITVYPNPSSGAAPVYFARSSTSQEIFVTVYDLVGKEVQVQVFPSGSKQLYLDKSKLNSGVYIYKAWSKKGELVSGKLIFY